MDISSWLRRLLLAASDRIPHTRRVTRPERGLDTGLDHRLETLGVDAAQGDVLFPLPSACPGCERGIRKVR
jgi:hypothetical protein